MALSLLRTSALLFAAMIAACSRGGGQTVATSRVASPSPIPTAGLPVAPSPVVPEADQGLLALAKKARVCGPGAFVSTAAEVNGQLYIGCRNVATAHGVGGAVLVVDSDMRTLHSLPTWMYSVESVTAAGAHAIAVSGYTDGAAMENQLLIIDSAHLKPIVKHALSDSTLLGVIGDRAYIDDWCCFGRADRYAPATIYSVSMNNGDESKHINLSPDPHAHPANLAPLGQGEHNYMQGHYFFVVVTDDNKNSITYRYNVFRLDAPPVRMRTSSVV